MHKKRGQISFVIIIVVVLIFVVGLLFLFSDKNGNVESDSEKSTISGDNSPINQLLIECSKQAALEAVNQVSARGGYISTEGFRNLPTDPTESDGVENPPNSGFFIPYWSFMKSENSCSSNCEYASYQRPLCKSGCQYSGENSIQEEIENYIENNMDSCTRNYASLRKTGYNITEKKNPDISITILEDEIKIDIQPFIEAEINGKSTEIGELSASVPTYLYELYEMAHEIAQYEDSECFLEKDMINAISYYSGLDPDKLPPIAIDSEDYVVWIKSQVKNKVKNINYNIMKMIRYYNTTNGDFYNPLNEAYKGLSFGIYNQFLHNPFDEYHEAIVNTHYMPWLEPYFDILPSNGEMIEPSSSMDSIPQFLKNLIPLNARYTYNYKYMYSYPVVIEIMKWNERRQENEVFRFSLEANIRGNSCFRDIGSARKFNTGRSSLLCDQEFRGNSNYIIKVKDDYTGEPIEGAKVQFYAGDTCNLGYTNSSGELETTVPMSDSGILIAEKEDYLVKFGFFDSLSRTSSYSLNLQPVFEKNIEVRIIDDNLIERIRNGSVSDKRQEARMINESYIFTANIEKIEDDYEDEFSDTVILNEDNPTGTLKLSKGEFSLFAQSIIQMNFSLPNEYDRACAPDALIGSCVKTPKDPYCEPRGDSQYDFENGDCYKQGYTCESKVVAADRGHPDYGPLTGFSCALPAPLPLKCIKQCKADDEIVISGINMSMVPLGGVMLDNNSIYFNIRSYDELNNSDKLVIYIYESELPDRIHKLNYFTKYINVSQLYPRLFKPEFI